MFNLTILYGSSCVGKSYLMNKMDNCCLKVEMDDCKYWLHAEEKRKNICINYLISKIKENLEQNKDMIVTCGYLPLPNNYIYKKLEQGFNINLKHVLVLIKNINTYKNNICKRDRNDLMNELILNYQWREKGKNLYDEIIYNDY